MVLHHRQAKGRKHLDLQGEPIRGKRSRKSAAGQREPWLLVASPGLELRPRQIVTLYARRMQIELSFRDLKSHRYGNAFEDSLTRSGKRLGILLRVHALANFASWLAGTACRATGIDDWLAPSVRQRRCYSIMRIGREELVRAWPIERTHQWLQRLHTLPSDVLRQMMVLA